MKKDIILKARNFLKEENVDYLLVNSTNEFLVEYNALDKNSRYHLTNFSGSSGEALVSKDKIWLFVDGRYHAQADLEVNHKEITVVKLQIVDKMIDSIAHRIDKNTTLAICSKKNSQFKYENLQAKLSNKNVTVKLVDIDPLESKSKVNKQKITDIPLILTGKSTEDKVKELSANLKTDEAILISNIEDLSYIFNKRNFDKTNSCSFEGKALIGKDSYMPFERDNLKYFDNFIKNSLDIQTIFVDKESTTAYDYRLIGSRAKELKLNPVRMTKCIKTDAELKHYKDAFRRTDLALNATREFIEENNDISELDIKNALEMYFKNYGAISQSFTSIVAINENSAIAHYSKSSKDKILRDGSLVLIDCGGYYEGGLATDTTRVFVKGRPTRLQKYVYTTVLKAFLKAFNATKFTCGYDLDKIARDYLEEKAPDGFVFNHGLGHGIGISVHEIPPRLSASGAISKIPIQENMCFTIEPGIYKQKDFGIRLENSCYFKNGKINSFTNMCFEKKLIDYTKLNEQELAWLSKFEVK